MEGCLKLSFQNSMEKMLRALVWHQQYVKKYGEGTPWEMYEGEVIKRFGAVYELVELHEAYAVSLFIEGLKNEVSMPIRMFKITTLAEDAKRPGEDMCGSYRVMWRGYGMSKEGYGARWSGQLYSLEIVSENQEELVIEGNDETFEDCVEEGTMSETSPRISLNALSGLNSF
ncbi:hypothetical protein Tco_0761866 [Tanacetum coccineum]